MCAPLRVAPAPFLLLLLLAACGDDPSAPVQAADITITTDITELELGDSTRLVARVVDASGAELVDRPVSWSTADPHLVRVTAQGWVVGLAGGTATVRADVDGRSATATIAVLPWNIADDVVVVDSTRLRLTSDPEERSAGVLRFDVLQGEPPTLSPGTVVVGAQAGGFLRRITTAEVTGGSLRLETEAAALADVVRTGSFASTVNLLFAPGVPAAVLGSAGFRPAPGEVVWGEGTFTYLAPGVVPRPAGFDLSGLDVCELLKEAEGPGCPDGIEKLEIRSGLLDFEPDLEVEASFDGFQLESFRGVATGDLSVDVALALDASVSTELEATPTMFTFTRPFLAQIGPVPVVGYVEMEVDGQIGAKATARGAVEAGYEATGHVELGAEWEDGWEPVSESTGDFEPRAPSIADGTLSASIELEASVGMKPRFQIIFYGVVGPFAQVEPFGKATLTFGTASCNLKTETGINAAIGFTIPFLDDDVADYDEKWEPIIEGPGSDWDCPLGTLDVGVQTTGTDEGGSYTVLVDDEPKGSVSPGDRITIEFVQVGERTVTLDGLPSNCSVDGEATPTVNVTPGATQVVDFTVACSALTGSIEVRTTTSGAAQDPDGYRVSAGGDTRPIGKDASVTFEGLAVGLQTVTLADVASNCEVTGGSVVDVQVAADATSTVTFDVLCSAAELVVKVLTTGPPASTSGWRVVLDGTQSKPVSPNGQTTFSTTPDPHELLLTGLPSNCEVEGSNPRTVDVSGIGATEAEFSVTCTSGGLTVTVSTEGDPDPATSYIATAGGQSLPVAVDGAVAFSDLPTGTVSVGLESLPEHCVVQGLNPRTVDVPGSVAFQVVCQEPAQCAEVPDGAYSIWQYVSDSSPDPGYPWSSGTAGFSVLTYGEVEGAVSAASSDEDEVSKRYTADTEWKDHLFVVPIDADRVDEEVTLRYRHVGYVEVVHSGSVRAQALVWAHHFGSRALAWYETENPESPQRIDFDETVEMPITLGAWEMIAGQVTLRAEAFGIASMSASAHQKITLVDVRDADGLLVPIAEVCAASGTEYVEEG